MDAKRIFVNCPFEAGLGYLLHETSKEPNKYQLLLLDSKPYQYQASLSDVGGMDAKIHNVDQKTAISAVRSFLVAKSGAQNVWPGGSHIWKHFNLFQEMLRSSARPFVILFSLSQKSMGTYE